MSCGVFYIIRKLLKCRYLKWALIAHLDIWNTSYGQKKDQESNSPESASFDSWPLKVENRPEILGCRERATYLWKGLDKIYNFASDRIAIRGLLAKLWGSKVLGVQFGAISGLTLGSLGKNSHLDVASVESCRVYYKGEGSGFPQGPGRGESCVSVLPVACPSTKSAPTIH